MQEKISATRWHNFGNSIFSEMVELVKKHNAVNLAQGCPDFSGDPLILEYLQKALLKSNNQYAPSSGCLELRKALVPFIGQKTGVEYDPETEITITSGATEAIYSTINALVNPGEKVIAFEPFFDTYPQAVANAGGIFLPIRLHAPGTPPGMQINNWAIDWQAFEQAMASNVKLIILNNPHNPTGKVFSEEEVEKIVHLALKYNTLILSDEVYEYLIYDQVLYTSPVFSPSARKLLIRISSAAKTFGYTGFKLGWICATPELTAAIRLVHQAVVFCTPPHIQIGFADLLEDASWLNNYLAILPTFYQQKRNVLLNILQENKFIVSCPQGAYFILANYSALDSISSDTVYIKKLISEFQICAIPTSAFYQTPPKRHPWIRFAFCKQDKTFALAKACFAEQKK